ncbi:BACON domain-containing protein [Alistipes putredinis]|uniref:BACON domain-containing protein n=1 Tax=Alistipes putredinis TaxID=28117 RepID=UPI003A8E5080
MKKSSIWKLLFSALTVFAVAVFAGCTDDNDDMGAPYLNVTPENLTFDAEGQPADEYNGTFIVETNRPWRAIVEDEQTWVRLSATEGEGDAAVTVTVPASNIGQSAKVTFEVYNSYGALIQKDVNVLQGEVVPPTLIFNETAGSESVANPYPLVADYTGWNTTGEGASKVSYEGVNTSIRASGKSSAGAYDGASGPNVIFFGSAPATFTVKDITLASDQTNLKLTFGGQYYDGDNNDNNFNKDNFVVYLSANGTDYTPLSYEVNDGDQVDPYWVFATKNFTLKNATSTLYIKFEAKASSKFRLDDITLMTGNGGEEIDLAGGGVVPPDPSGDAIYENNFDKTPAEKVDNKWPFLDQTDAWQNASGTGNSTVTYTSANVSVRTSGKLSGGYDGASGSNKIFFGSAPATFDINTITMPAGKTNYRIIFGGAYSQSNGGTYDNIFKPESFHVAVGNGTDWSGNLTYEKIGGSDTTDPYWVQFAVDFTLKEAVGQLSIRFTADVASVFAIDDVQLVEGNGGQEVDLEGGVVPPDPGEVVAFSITDIKADNADLPTNGYGSQVVATSSTWVSWTVGGIEFTGVKICESPASNGSIIQMQGNDSDAAKQAKLQNVTPIDGMSKIKIVFRSYPNKSGSYYNPGYTMTVAGAAQTPVETYTDKSGYREYVHEYDLAGLGADSFVLDNNKGGALYIESFEITK